MRIFVGISGASGSIYGGRLLRALSETGHEVTVCISDGAIEVMRLEEELALPREAVRDEVAGSFLSRYGLESADLSLVSADDMASTFASGSSLAGAAVICPCSMSTLGCVAAGVTRNLIHRVADVMLKEARPLVLVPRETPLSEIHLRNLLAVRRAGAFVVPAMPGFYHHPATIEDMVDFVVGKVLDALKIPNELFERWNR